MPNATLDKAPLPYMSSSLLKGTIDAFTNSVVPGALDRNVLNKMSGGDYGALISGLRFLGLVEATGTKPTPAFQALVKAREKGVDDYQSQLLMVINGAYDKILGNFDIDTGTLVQLEKAFRDYGVPNGQMLHKTIRFYVKSLQDCGITVSPYITKRRRSPNGGSKKLEATKAKVVRERETPPADEREGLPQGFARQPIPGVEGAFVQYPLDLTDADCALFEAIVGVLRTYAQARKGGA